jgi:uncharacterized protein
MAEVMADLELSHEGADPSHDPATLPSDEVPIFTFLLVKLASRCNINCSYCYWFRDAEVYKKPAVLTVQAEDAFCEALEEHIVNFALDRFAVVFHGGEPLLFPKHRFISLQEKLLDVEARTGCEIGRGLCTNAILIDREWTEIFNKYAVDVTVSLDGPPDIHDKYRVDFKGEGTHAQTLDGIGWLRGAGIEPGLIVVCNPATDPERVLAYVVEELGIKQFDVLPPDATHADNPPPIHDYFIKLFDVWFDKYAAQGVRIITLDAMIQGLLGSLSAADTIGLGPIDTVTLMTDGTLEPLDVLRIAGNGSTKSDCSVFSNALQDVENDERWRAAFHASVHHCETCLRCEYFDACGGGHLAQRWSRERGFDNPSVYCESWKKIFDHLWTRISPTLILEYKNLPDGRQAQRQPTA